MPAALFSLLHASTSQPPHARSALTAKTHILFLDQQHWYLQKVRTGCPPGAFPHAAPLRQSLTERSFRCPQNVRSGDSQQDAMQFYADENPNEQLAEKAREQAWAHFLSFPPQRYGDQAPRLSCAHRPCCVLFNPAGLPAAP